MDKKKSLFCILFLTLFLLGTTNNSFTLRGTTNNSFAIAEIKNKAIPLSSANDTIFGTPIIDPLEPSSTTDVSITCPINDTDGIQNATLYWKYTTVDSITEYNTTMVKVDLLVVDTTVFERTGYITYTGVETTDPQNRRFGEYIYETQSGENISQIDVEVRADDPMNLVYVLIQAKNIITGVWEDRYEIGSFSRTTDVVPYPIIYSSLELTAGYLIYAVSYRNTGTRYDPTFGYLQIYETASEYQVVIPAIDQPTWVDYHIEVYDQMDNLNVSDTYKFLMDSAPTIQFNDLQTLIGDDRSLNLNVSVTDADGWGNMQVIAYYHIETPSTWSSSSLSFSSNSSSITAYYTGSISIPDVGNVEKDLTLYVNASDLVGGTVGRRSTTGEETILIDGQNPYVENIDVEGGVSIPGVEDIVLTTANVTITADFVDPSGIDEVNIYYAIPNGTTFIKKEMANLTSSEPNDSPVSYTAILPPANHTYYVDYYFEAKDYLGNIGTSSVYSYYADGAAPTLTALKVYPNLITEDTAVNVLFNAIDPSNLEDSVVWYQVNNASWDNVIAQDINYNILIDYQETYTAENLPVLIEDKNTTTIDLEVKRNGKVDTASVNVELTHENAADLRIWLRSGGKRVLLYDRMPDMGSFTVTEDLFAYGFDEEDFSLNLFQLEIEDFSLDFSGSVTDFSIELIHHSITIGYEFRGIIPATTVDADVQFRITLTDSLLNTENTSILTYYADALAPTINVTPIISPVDLGGTLYSIEVSANVTDKGGVLDVYLYYKFAAEDVWGIVDMTLGSGDLYSGKINVNSPAGKVFFKVRAFDLISHSAESNVTEINFTNGLYPNIIVLNTPFTDPIDMNGSKVFTIHVEIIDQGIITSATLFYRFKSSGDWTELALEYNPEVSHYVGNIAVTRNKGLMQFKIRATDDSNFTAETGVYEVNYINSGSVNPVWIIVPSSVGGAALIGGAVFFVLKKRRRWGKK